eukprot:GDKK01040481.1.p1 GENE.GDKK01040481.1~~GDKK01040481.1.p1  ORF type:complete len:1220 (-),score=275.38 GDKK01040481.1:1288-4602(-)
MAGVGDWFLYILGARLFGVRAGKIAMIAYMMNWFTLYCITRTFSNTMETVILTACLAVWPWEEDTNRTKQPVPLYDGLIRATFLGGFAVAIRPTAALLIVPLALVALVRAMRCPRPGKASLLVFFKVVPGILVTAVLILIPDYIYYGNKWTLPFVNFLKFNAVAGASALYGTNSPFYFFAEAPLAMMSIFLPFFLLGVWRTLFPSQRRLSNELDSVLGAKLLILIWLVPNLASSLSPHKEYRFVLPTLPIAFALIGDAIRSRLFRHRDDLLEWSAATPAAIRDKIEQHSHQQLNDSSAAPVSPLDRPLTNEELKNAIGQRAIDEMNELSAKKLAEKEERKKRKLLKNQRSSISSNNFNYHSKSSEFNDFSHNADDDDEQLYATALQENEEDGLIYNSVPSSNRSGSRVVSSPIRKKEFKMAQDTVSVGDIEIEEVDEDALGSDVFNQSFNSEQPIETLSSRNNSSRKSKLDSSNKTSSSPTPSARPSRLFGMRRRGHENDSDEDDDAAAIAKIVNEADDSKNVTGVKDSFDIAAEEDERKREQHHEAGGDVNDFQSPSVVMKAFLGRIYNKILGHDNSKKLHYTYKKAQGSDDSNLHHPTSSSTVSHSPSKSVTARSTAANDPASPSKGRSLHPSHPSDLTKVHNNKMRFAPIIIIIYFALNVSVSLYFLFVHQSGSVSIAQTLGEMVISDAKDPSKAFDWTHDSALVPAGGTRPPRQVGIKKPFTVVFLTECHATPFRSQMHVPPANYPEWKRNVLSQPLPTLSILDCAPRNVTSIPPRILELNPSLRNTKYTRDFTENWLYHQAPLAFLEWSYGVSGVFKGNRDYEVIENEMGCQPKKTIGHCLERPGCSWHSARLDDEVDSHYAHKIRVHHKLDGTNTAVGCFPLAAAPQCTPYNDFCSVTWRFVGDGQDVNDAIKRGAWEGHHTVFERTVTYNRSGPPLQKGQIRTSGQGPVWLAPKSVNVVRTAHGEDAGKMKTLSDTNLLHEEHSSLEISVRREDIFWTIDRIGFHRITARVQDFKGRNDDLRDVVPTPFYLVINARQGGEILPFLLRHGFEFRTHHFHAHRPQGDFDSGFEIWARKSDTSMRPVSFRGFYDTEKTEL